MPDTSPSPQPLAEQVWVVTGASRGFGRCAALAAGRRGAQIVALARTKAGLEELDDDLRKADAPKAVLAPVDLRDADALHRLGPVLAERFGKVDVLLHAAGHQGGLAPVWDISPTEFASALAVNAVAAHGLVRALQVLLVNAGAGRAVFVSDSTPPDPPAFWGPYAAGKAALSAFAEAYAGEAGPMGVGVALFDPGPMRTGLRARVFPGEEAARAVDPGEPAAWLIEWLSKAVAPEPVATRLRYPDFAPAT